MWCIRGDALISDRMQFRLVSVVIAISTIIMFFPHFIEVHENNIRKKEIKEILKQGEIKELIKQGKISESDIEQLF